MKKRATGSRPSKRGRTTTKEITMKTGTFVFSELRTPRPRDARGFYTKLFGWEYQDVPAPEPYALVRCGGDTIGGIAGGHPTNEWLVYVGVADVKATTAMARKLGATVEVDCQKFGDMGTLTVLVDPAGARFAVWQAAAGPT